MQGLGSLPLAQPVCCGHSSGLPVGCPGLTTWLPPLKWHILTPPSLRTYLYCERRDTCRVGLQGAE